MRNTARSIVKQLVHLTLPRHFLWRVDGGSSVCITFDDGPNTEYTGAILDLLAKHRLTATFFLIGRNVKRHPELARRIVKEQHTVGGHGFEHLDITSLSRDSLRAELEGCRAAIADATGIDTLLFRPPRGKVNLRALFRVAREGYTLVHWSKTYSDYLKDGSAALRARLDNDPPKNSDILLFHDNNKDTFDALSGALPVWVQSGLVFKPL